jgi:acyl carrier protein
MNDRLAIRTFLQDLLNTKSDRQGFSDSDSLIASGRLQSIDTLEIVLFLEDNYSIDFAERGFDQNELDSVDSIMALIGERSLRHPA